MTASFRTVSLSFLAVALTSVVVSAAPAPPPLSSSAARDTADLLPSVDARRLSARAGALARPITAAAAPTVDEVGDIDSFGRNLTWLGITQGSIDLAPACPIAGGDPAAPCVPIAAAPAVTTFNLPDIARITLPAKASNSLLCHWFSPVLNTSYDNPTSAAVVGRLAYSPTLTVENPVLDDPALIDPQTGLPFNGRLLTGMTASQRFEVPLPAGLQLNERKRDSATCIAGFLTRRSLVDNYGLTEAQAKQFFRKPTVIRLNVSGSARYVSSAQMIFGLRVVGD